MVPDAIFILLLDGVDNVHHGVLPVDSDRGPNVFPVVDGVSLNFTSSILFVFLHAELPPKQVIKPEL